MLRCGNYIDSARFSRAKTTARHVLQTAEASMNLLLLVILLILVLGALPTWPYSQGWGYYPSGGLGFAAADPHHRGPGAWTGEPVTTSRAA